MKKVVLLAFVSTLLSLAVVLELPTPVVANPAEIVVPDDYEKIQWAINNVSDGYTIFVRAGTYYEHVMINKSVSLIGENRDTTIIDGNRTGRVVSVTASHVYISGFTIRNSGPGPCGRGYGGIYLRDNSSTNIIRGNTITNGSGGIEIIRSHSNAIQNNLLSNNSNFGIDLYDSADNVISNNIIANNYYAMCCDFGSTRNNVNNNTISNNVLGIYLNYASQNTFRNNNLTDNNYGIRMGLGIGLEHFDQVIDMTNLVNGKPVCYLVQQQNILVDTSAFPHGVGYLGIVGSKNVTVKEVSVSGNYQGVFLAHTTDSTLQNISVSDCYCGIHLFRSTRNTVTGCNLSSHNGVYLEASDDNLVLNNTMINSGFGIELYFNVAGNILSNNRILGPVFGIDSYTCYNNTVTENVVSNCSSGISLRGSRNIISKNNASYCEYGGVDIALSNFTVVSGNLLTHNGMGVWIDKSDHNTIFGNTLIYNDHGFDVRYCNNNTFYHNNVVNNTVQAYLVDTINEWDNGYPSGGNYWSDYIDVDLYSGPYQNETGSDGIGDAPYDIDENNQDNYPLMGMFSDFNATSEYRVQTICNSSISDLQFNGTAISFNVTGENGTTGFCRICIPTALMNGTYKIFVNGTEVPYTLLPCSNSTHSYLYFTYNHSTQEVLIIPEFPTWTSMLLILIVLTLATAIYKRRLFCCS